MTVLRRHLSIDHRLKGIALAALLLIFGLGLAAPGWATTFYVSTSGNDSSNGLAPAPGTAPSGPFRTLQRASYAVKPGDSVLIRGGVYQAGSSWVNDGTEAAPITISNYNGETVIIDGNGHTIPSVAEGILLQIFGDWNIVSNLEVRYSSATGVAVHGAHCTVRNVYSHHNWGAGIYITGWYGLIENCRAQNNSLKNEYAVLSISWSFGISACRYPQYTTIRGCTSWDNWGEGISTFEGQHNTIEDCVSYNNMCNYYVSDSKYTLFQRNLGYYTPGNISQSYCTQNNISAGDERYNPPSSDNTFINNLAMGGERNFAMSGNTLTNVLVAHNTFVNGSNTIGPTEAADIYFFAGTATNARVVNNIFVQDTPESSVMICHLETRGITFSNNCWSRLPVSGARGSGDVVADPQLLRAGSMSAGELSPGWFRIADGSPARNKALVLSQVPQDFAKTARGGTPDMGAFNVPDDASTLTASASGTPTSGMSPLTVSFLGTPAGGAPPYTTEWTFGDGSTSNTANAVHIYTAPGHYVATFTVTDGNKATAVATVSVAVESSITSVVTAFGAASALSGTVPLTVNFTAGANGGEAPYTYSWSFGDGTASTTQNAAHVYTAAGTYAVKLTVTDHTGTTATYDLVVRVTSLFTAKLSASCVASPTAGLAPLTVQFVGTPSGGTAPYTYLWTYGDGTASTVPDPPHVFKTAGTYNVIFTVKDSRGATVSKAITIQVGPLPTTPKNWRIRKKIPSIILRNPGS